MAEKLHLCIQKKRTAIYAASMILILLFFMLWPVNFFLAQSLLSYIGMYSFPVIAMFYLYFRGFRDGKEIKLLILFCVWLLITRVLNGDVALAKDGWIVVEALLMFCFAGLGLVLDRKSGELVLKLAAIAAGLFFFVLGTICVYHWIRLDYTINPLTEAILGVHFSYGYFLIILGENRNISAMWFYIASCLLLWLFFKCRKKVWRVPIVAAIVINYLVITGTYSRNVRLAFSVSVGMLCLLLFLKAGLHKRRIGILLAAILLLGSTALTYKSFDWTANGAAAISYTVRHREEAAAPQRAHSEGTSAQALRAENGPRLSPVSERETGFGDARAITDDNGRFSIYRTIPEIFKRDPKRLLIGCLDEERMSVTNELLQPSAVSHLHNSFLDVLNNTGLPGLILALGFCVLLAVDACRVFFTENAAVGISEKVLTIPLAGIIGYSMLESLLFVKQDFRSLSFFLICGYVIRYARLTREKG